MQVPVCLAISLYYLALPSRSFRFAMPSLMFPLLIASLCLILSCHANQARSPLHHEMFGALSRLRKTAVLCSSTCQAQLAITQSRGVAFIPTASLHKQRIKICRSVAPQKRLATLPRLFQRSYLASVSNDDAIEGQQKGMEEAFASLEALSSEDWNANTNNAGGNENIATLKYSRTDDTPAADSGKSTEEEVGYYLEMQEELEGTAMPKDGGDQVADEENELQLFELDEIDGEDIEEGLDSEEYPWTSNNPILRLRGPVASGYGRGGKQLGVPTANLPASLFQSALEDVSNGVYFGWAVIESSPSDTRNGRNVPIKAVVNVGYSPTFEGQENKEKIVEAHLITNSSPMSMPEDTGEEQFNNNNDTDEIEGDFYDETMRLQLIGYLRPEQKFDSFPDLIAQIHRDIGNANWALDEMPFVFSKEDEFVKNGFDWVGSGGGDGSASWEFESW